MPRGRLFLKAAAFRSKCGSETECGEREQRRWPEIFLTRALHTIAVASISNWFVEMLLLFIVGGLPFYSRKSRTLRLRNSVNHTFSESVGVFTHQS